MNQIIMLIMAAGVVIGGLDRLLGNRLGLGKRFEEGFQLLGPTALSMVGIICLTPIVSSALKTAVVPLWHLMGLDPAMLGGLLAIDMGGYQLAMALADSPQIGGYAGIIVAAILGCTITFTVPVGMGMLSQKERPAFARGMLLGLSVMPAALMAGGMLCGLSPLTTFFQSCPYFSCHF